MKNIYELHNYVQIINWIKAKNVQTQCVTFHQNIYYSSYTNDCFKPFTICYVYLEDLNLIIKLSTQIIYS